MTRSTLALLALLALSSCGSDAPPPDAGGALDAFVVATPPPDAKSVLEVRTNAKPGDEVVVRGRAKDFVDGLAAFTIIDTSLRACSDEGDAMQDTCKTPWDYCCIPPEEISGASATVEFRDGSKVLKQSAQGFRGLDHLDTVIVRGVLERDATGNVTVVAKNFAFTANAGGAK